MSMRLRYLTGDARNKVPDTVPRRVTAWGGEIVVGGDGGKLPALLTERGASGLSFKYVDMRRW